MTPVEETGTKHRYPLRKPEPDGATKHSTAPRVTVNDPLVQGDPSTLSRPGNNTLIDTFLITLPLMLSPGPANLVSLAFSSRYGSRQIVLFQCGILLVYAVVAFGMAVTAIQLGDFFMNSAAFLQIAGGAFIIYLGIGLILTPQKPGESGSAPTFRSGALLQIFNPKFPPVVLAILSTRSDTNFLATAGIIVTVGAIGLALYSSVGSLIHRFVSADRHLRLLNIVFGLLLCAVGVWITVGAVSARWFVFSSG